MSGKNHHPLPLWGLFLALLALTAGEVGLYELWRATEFVSKLAIIFIVLALTLPKAAIVMVYFMHLKFEKHLVVGLALFPIIFVFICVLTVVSDTKTIKSKGQAGNIVQTGHITGQGPERPAGKPAPAAGGEYE